MDFGVKVMSAPAGRAVAGAVEVVIRIGAELDRIICTKIVVCDEVGDGARDGTVRAGRGR